MKVSWSVTSQWAVVRRNEGSFFPSGDSYHQLDVGSCGQDTKVTSGWFINDNFCYVQASQMMDGVKRGMEWVGSAFLPSSVSQIAHESSFRKQLRSWTYGTQFHNSD